MRLLIKVSILILVSASLLEAQVKNPTQVQFAVSADHAQVTSYELDFIRVSDNAVIQTINVGKPTPNASGVAVANINVQPVAFGIYRSVMRAVAGTAKSINSEPSPNWERAPGPPSKPAMQ